jgi:hypothetical protein
LDQRYRWALAIAIALIATFVVYCVTVALFLWYFDMPLNAVMFWLAQHIFVR